MPPSAAPRDADPAPRHEHLHDRSELAEFLVQDPGRHLYTLGDLDPAYWPWTTWYGWRRAGVLREVVLVYGALARPVVMAFTQHESADMDALIHAIAPVLPVRFHAHVDLRSADAVRGHRRLRSYGPTHRMVLPPNALAQLPVSAPPPPPGLEVLQPEQAPEIRALLQAAYPENFFEARMVASGGYLGVRHRGTLVAVAGLHVLAPRYQAAALGNVAVHPDHRGHGLGLAVTRALCVRLIERGIRHVGLNVRTRNGPAVALYRAIGFEPIFDYLEACATLPDPGAGDG